MKKFLYRSLDSLAIHNKSSEHWYQYKDNHKLYISCCCLEFPELSLTSQINIVLLFNIIHSHFIIFFFRIPQPQFTLVQTNGLVHFVPSWWDVVMAWRDILGLILAKSHLHVQFAVQPFQKRAIAKPIWGWYMDMCENWNRQIISFL